MNVNSKNISKNKDNYLRIQVGISLFVFFVTTFYLFGITGIVAPISIGLILELLYLKNKVNLSKKILIIGLIYAISGSYSAYFLYNYSLTLSRAVVCCVILSDISAYYIGKLYGKRKLYPSISPNKTILGAVAGILTGASIFSFMTMSLSYSFQALFISGVIISILGIMGDLLISKIKRAYQIKDSSGIFPGHGGVWDRFDSILLVLNILGIYFYYIS